MKLTLPRFALISALFLAGAANAQVESESAKAESPQDFAYGAPITLTDSASFYQLTLPKNVYTETSWPDMRDVRIFNSQGKAVPFALKSTAEETTETRSVATKIFSMDGYLEKSESSSDTFFLKSSSGLEARILMKNEQVPEKTYLVELPKEGEGYPNLSELKLTWEPQKENWQTRVSVRYSDDLLSWNEGVIDAPLMSLVSGDDKMLLDTIDLSKKSSLYAPRYILLTFYQAKEQAIPNLIIAQGIVKSKTVAQPQVSIEFEENKIGEKNTNEIIYSLPTAQYLHSVSIRLTESGSVIPAEIEYRSSEKGEWNRLTKTVIYNLDHKPFSVPTDKRLIKDIRLKTKNDAGDISALMGKRDVVNFVFNIQGNPPFLLAWGSKAAQNEVLNIDELIPQALKDSVSLQDIPLASLEPTITLGGKDRLTLPTVSEKASLWKKGVLWALLILGAGGLVVLALKVWREVQQKTE